MLSSIIHNEYINTRFIKSSFREHQAAAQMTSDVRKKYSMFLEVKYSRIPNFGTNYIHGDVSMKFVLDFLQTMQFRTKFLYNEHIRL